MGRFAGKSWNGARTHNLKKLIVGLVLSASITDLNRPESEDLEGTQDQDSLTHKQWPS